MTEQNWFSKAMQDFTLTRRSFVKWSAALGGAVAVSGGARSLLKSGKITGIAEAADNNLYGAEKIVPVICGCGDVCGMYHMGQAYVKEGKIVYYEGCKEAENKGALCARGMSAMQVINHPDRVKYPMKRLNAKGEIGEFERISWDEAYDTIAEKMAAAMKNEGPQTVGTSVGHIMDFGGNYAAFDRFKSMFNTDSAGGADGCWNDLSMGGWYTLGDYYHAHVDDFHHSKLIVIWGHNKAVAMPSEWSHGVWEAKQKYGAKLIVIDPRFTETAEKADLYLPVRPGTDAALALGMANVIITEGLQDDDFISKYTTGYAEYKELALQYPPEKVAEITWCPADKIRTAARWYATMKPALIEIGRGGNYTGGKDSNSGWMLSRGASCLIGLCGQAGMRGAGYSVENSTVSPSGTAFVNGTPLGNLSWKDEPLVPREVKSGGINSFYFREPYGYQVIYTISEIASKFCDQNAAEAALMQVPFLVVENRLVTYTASRFADIVLPSAVWTEQAIVRAEYTHIVCAGPAVEPMFESKPTYLILGELAERLCQKLGVNVPQEKIWPWKTNEEIVNALFTNPELPLGGYPNLNYQEAIKHPEGYRLTRYYNQEGFIPYKAKHYLDNPPNPEEIYFPTVGGTGKLEFNSPWLTEKFNLPSLPVPDEPPESPVRTPDIYKEYPLLSHTRVHRHWGFLHFNLASDGGYASDLMREAHETASEPTVELSPKMAEQLGLAEGDMVWVESRHGKLQGRLLLSRRIPDWMVVTPYHWADRQNRINPISESPIVKLPMIGPYGKGKTGGRGGQNIMAGILCKVYKA